MIRIAARTDVNALPVAKAQSIELQLSARGWPNVKTEMQSVAYELSRAPVPHKREATQSTILTMA
jgi:hypothetical protein